MIELVIRTENNNVLATLYEGLALLGSTSVATESEAKAWAYGKLDGVYDDSRPVEVTRSVTYRFGEV